MTDSTELNDLFSTVLVSRLPHNAPSELELQLRRLSKRLRVVEKLSGGAHLLLPSDSTIAIRVYYPPDLEKLNQRDDWEARTEAWNQVRLLDDPENLAGFRDSYQFPFVFFILPSNQYIAEHLDQAGSFMHQAQMIMNGCGGTINAEQSNIYGRSFIVPDTVSIVKILEQLVVNLKPEKRALKDRYFMQARTKFFFPDPVTGIPPSIDAASIHIKHEFRKWADTYELPAGEAEVFFSYLGSLGAIARASHVDLEHVPVDEDTKHLLHNFFGSESNPQRNNLNEHTLESESNFELDFPPHPPPPPSSYGNVNIPSQIFYVPQPCEYTPMQSDRLQRHVAYDPRQQFQQNQQIHQHRYPSASLKPPLLHASSLSGALQHLPLHSPAMTYRRMPPSQLDSRSRMHQQLHSAPLSASAHRPNTHCSTPGVQFPCHYF